MEGDMPSRLSFSSGNAHSSGDKRSLRSWTNIQLKPKDASIICACPSGTRRRTENLVKIRTANNLTWIHVSCKPLKAERSEDTAATADEILQRAANAIQDGCSAHDIAERFTVTTFAGPTGGRQLQKARNLTSKFRCDGPCRGSTNFEDYLWCYTCYAWQHKSCMLFGEDGDRGRPVCNTCYINSMIYQEEFERWQKQRLAQAGLEALRFIRDANNEHDTHGLEFARTFLGRLVLKNRGNFVQFVVNRRRVVRWLKARRGLDQPTYGNNAQLPAVVGDPFGVDSDAPLAGSSKRLRNKRKHHKSTSSGSAVSGDGLDDLLRIGDDEDEGSEYGDQDTIRVGKTNGQHKTNRSGSKGARDPPAFKPLVVDLTAEDEAQNARMRAIAERKARKKAAAASNRGSADVKDEDQAGGTFDDQDFSDIGILSNREKQNLIRASRQVSRPARKSAPSIRSHASALGVEGGDGRSILPPTKRSKDGQRHRLDNENETAGDLSLKWRTRSHHHDADQEQQNDQQPSIMCSCIGVTSVANCFMCHRCDQYQHIACASRPSKNDKLCKLCVGSGVVAANTTESSAVASKTGQSLAPDGMPPNGPVRFPTMAPGVSPPRSTPVPSLAGPHTANVSEAKHEPLSEPMQQEVRTLCSTILWDAYCDLPDPKQPSRRGNAQNSKTPPPANWLAEAEKRVRMMFEAAGEAKVLSYLSHEFKQWPRSGVNIVKALREFGMWMRIRGPFRRTRSQMGLLAEILGFDEKGTMWKGGVDEKDDEVKEEVKDEAKAEDG